VAQSWLRAPLTLADGDGRAEEWALPAGQGEPAKGGPPVDGRVEAEGADVVRDGPEGAEGARGDGEDGTEWAGQLPASIAHRAAVCASEGERLVLLGRLMRADLRAWEKAEAAALELEPEGAGEGAGAGEGEGEGEGEGAGAGEGAALAGAEAAGAEAAGAEAGAEAGAAPARLARPRVLVFLRGP